MKAEIQVWGEYLLEVCSGEEDGGRRSTVRVREHGSDLC